MEISLAITSLSIVLYHEAGCVQCNLRVTKYARVILLLVTS